MKKFIFTKAEYWNPATLLKLNFSRGISRIFNETLRTPIFHNTYQWLLPDKCRFFFTKSKSR